jgi:hypothetical protein
VALGEVNFGVFAAAKVVAQDDAIRGGAAKRVAFPGVQGKDFPEALLVAQNEISRPRVSHNKYVTSRQKKWCDPS